MQESTKQGRVNIFIIHYLIFQTYVEPILLYNAEKFTVLTEKQIEKCKNGRISVLMEKTLLQLHFSPQPGLVR